MTAAQRCCGAIVSIALLSGCRPSKPPPPPTAPVAPAVSFERVNGRAGIRFRHDDGSSGRKYFAEVMGPGCAMADFSGTGHPDLYLVNGAALPGAPSGRIHGNRFYRNNGDGTFTDATGRAGLEDGRYGVGCAAADFDNDGHLDLYVTHLGRNTLYRNRGNGSFEDVTERAGVGAPGFTTGAAFADYDGDGWTDLFVAHYVQWSPERNVDCKESQGQSTLLVYCRPTVYPPAASQLFRNNRDGTFTDRTAALSPRPLGRSLGCIWSDLSGSGRPDLFVANDMGVNFLYRNRGDGTFREEALSSGVAVGDNGQPQASMGVAAADVDGDGRIDLASTSFSGEYTALYHNLGKGRFEDVSARSGVVEATAPYVGFGITLADLNLDGYPDLFVANGHVTEAAEQFYPGVTFAQPSVCLVGSPDHRFTRVPNPGEAVTAPRVSRGVAVGDYDGDGLPDLLVSNWRGEPDLLRNTSARHGNWVRVQLEGSRSNRSAIGARVEAKTGGRTQIQEVHSGGSYCSQNELAVTFGIGEASSIDSLRIVWPGGQVQNCKRLAANRSYRFTQPH